MVYIRLHFKGDFDMRYYAQLVNSCGCVLDTLSATDMVSLRKEIVSDFVPVLDEGDSINITCE
jgi:hypothetical protein